MSAFVGLAVLACATTVLGLSFWNGHHLRSAQQAFELRQFQQADVYLRKRFAFGFGDLQAELLAIQIARRSGNIEEATKRLRRCQKLHPGDPSVALEERLLALQQGDLQQAKELLGSETPWVLEAYIVGSLEQLSAAYAQNQMQQGSEWASQLVDTRQAIEQWLRVRPELADQVQGLVWRYQAHLYGHSHALARLDVERALELDPHHRQARMMLANYLGQEHLPESAVQWQQLHDAHPDDVGIGLNLAEVRRHLGQLEEAEAVLEQVLARDASNVSALMSRGRVAQDLQQLAAAEHWFRTAYRLDPESPHTNLALSRCLQAAGKLHEAEFFQDRFDQMNAEAMRLREAAVSSTSP